MRTPLFGVPFRDTNELPYLGVGLCVDMGILESWASDTRQGDVQIRLQGVILLLNIY